MAKVSGIYIIVNTKNGKVYVGSAQDFRERWNQHKRELNGNKHDNHHLQAAWNKYGAKWFKFLKLEYCDIEQLNEREQHHIDIYRAKGICYNIALYADAPMRGRTHSEESRCRMSEAGKGNKNSLGVHPSEETRRKLSEASKNRPPPSEETRRKISEAKKGHAVSEETRRKMSEANKGNKNSLGVHPSEETRRKISEAGKNRPPPSEKTRRKISEAAKHREASRRAEREASNE